MNRWFNDISPDHSKPRDYAQGENRVVRFLRRYSCSIGMYCGMTDILRLVSWCIAILSWSVLPDRRGTFILICIQILIDFFWRGSVYYQNTQDRNRRQIKLVSFWMSVISSVVFIVSRLSDKTGVWNPSVLSSACFLIVVANLSTIIQVYRIRRGRISYVLRVGMLFLWGYIACRSVHECYLDRTGFKQFSDSIHSFLFPNAIVSGITSTNWLSIGTTFFVGCLIIISWSKERPCKAWNPFSAQELGMESGLLDTAIVCLSAMLYSVFSELKGLSFYIMILLLGTDMYTLFLCNSQHIDSLVRRKIIQNMDVLSVADRVANQPETGIGEWHGTKGSSVEYENVKREMIAYSQTIASISRACFCSNRRISNIARDMILLATDVCLTLEKQDSNSVSTLAFVFGLSCVPETMLSKKEPSYKKIRIYADELCDVAYLQDTYKGFFQGFMCGIHYAMINIDRKAYQSDKIDVKYLESRKDTGEHLGEFIVWILEKDIHKGYENWAWLREIKQALS